jgi:hypothetical protein
MIYINAFRPRPHDVPQLKVPTGILSQRSAGREEDLCGASFVGGEKRWGCGFRSGPRATPTVRARDSGQQLLVVNKCGMSAERLREGEVMSTY